MKCDQCGRELSIGDWPFCPHGSIHGQTAAVHAKERAVKYYHPEHGWRTPGRTDAPMPERMSRLGFQRVEFESLNELDKHSKATGSFSEVADFDKGSGGAERSYGKI